MATAASIGMPEEDDVLPMVVASFDSGEGSAAASPPAASATTATTATDSRQQGKDGKDKGKAELAATATDKEGRHDDLDAEESAPVVSQRRRRRKRRRQLYQMLQGPRSVPSFLAVITQTEEDMHDMSEITPPVVVIDVDEYIGLKKPPPPTPDPATSSADLAAQMQLAIEVQQRNSKANSNKNSGSRSNGNNNRSNHISNANTSLATKSNQPRQQRQQRQKLRVASRAASDGRWYEGCLSLEQDMDKEYLTGLQQFVKRHTQVFSASDIDVAMNAGRKNAIARGRVGLRCIHCAAALTKHLTQTSSRSSWPAGAVAYPATVSALYSNVNSRPQQHFEKNCPYLPEDAARQFEHLLKEYRATQSGMEGTASSQRFKRRRHSLNTSQYYAVSCCRLGLYEMPEGQGLRFGWETSARQLSFTDARKQVESGEYPSNSSNGAATAASGVSPGSKTNGRHLQHGDNQNGTSPSARRSPIPSQVTSSLRSSPRQGGGSRSRGGCDEETLAIIDQARKARNPPNSILLGHGEDFENATDYMFLTIQQMAVCHASETDMTSRGKKNRIVQPGFAGFGCRHCQATELLDKTPRWAATGTCRCFCSHRDNLASAISNSLAMHMQKCKHAPDAIKKALTQTKRVHSRQIQTMPYGSQRKLIHSVWARMRQHDRLTGHGHDNETRSNSTSPTVGRTRRQIAQAKAKQIDIDFDPAEEGSDGGDPNEPRQQRPRRQQHQKQQNGGYDSPTELEKSSTARPKAQSGKRKGATSPKKIPPLPAKVPIMYDKNRANARSEMFPVCTDPATVAMLKQYEDNWVVNKEMDLITPELRHLVSDYVFLTARQLKIAVPTAADFTRNKRNNVLWLMAGFCCIHCAAKDTEGDFLSGRSFPSAPDNMASAFNSSLYNHFQSCPHISSELKSAMAMLRKIHSNQCATLKFGSQRKFFNHIFDQLKAIPVDQRLISGVGRDAKPPAEVPAAKPSARGTSPQASKSGAMPSTSKATAPTLPASAPAPAPTSLSRPSVAANGHGGRNGRSTQGSQAKAIDRDWLRRHGFVQHQKSFVQCTQCRMVPFHLRTPGSVVFLDNDGAAITENGNNGSNGQRPRAIPQHQANCAKMNLNNAAIWNELNELLILQKGLVTPMGTFLEEFSLLVTSALGGNRRLYEGLISALATLPTTAQRGNGIGSIAITALPVSVNTETVIEAYLKLRVRLGWSERPLTDGCKILDFLHFVSPHLHLDLATIEGSKARRAQDLSRVMVYASHRTSNGTRTMMDVVRTTAPLTSTPMMTLSTSTVTATGQATPFTMPATAQRGGGPSASIPTRSLTGQVPQNARGPPSRVGANTAPSEASNSQGFIAPVAIIAPSNTNDSDDVIDLT